VSGWQLGEIYQVGSGLPFTPIIGGDPLGLKTSYPFDFPDRIVAPASLDRLDSRHQFHDYPRTAAPKGYGMPFAEA
jgi:hypothetical protein